MRGAVLRVARRWLRRELGGWIVVIVLSLAALLTTLEILGVGDEVGALIRERRTAAFCKELRAYRAKHRRELVKLWRALRR